MTQEFCLDWDRGNRTGLPEAVLCSHKSAAQIARIVDEASALDARLLLTRIDAPTLDDLPHRTRAALSVDAPSSTAWLGPLPPGRNLGIGIVTAGTSDSSVAAEARSTLRFHGVSAPLIADVGVAGLWRLLERLEELRRFRLIIAVAGMEGALFSVLAGLVPAPVIAVPSSIGYGVSQNGQAALSSALASCAPGILTVNIDNGFGAATAAIKLAGSLGL